MARHKTLVPPDVLVAKLSDEAILRNYAMFAGLHRDRMARALFSRLGDQPDDRRSIGLELMANLAAALEDVTLWFFVLQEWRAGAGGLFDLLDSISVVDREGYPYSSEQALNQISTWTIVDLREKFGLPLDDDLAANNWSEELISGHVEALEEALRILQSAIRTRTDDDRILVNSYNKLKHGALAIATTELSPVGVSVLVPSRRGPLDPKTGRRKINFGWVACDDADLRHMVNETIAVSSALWKILCLLYASRFDGKWVPPPHPQFLAAG
jgi:hypothetical protein